jgi:hypothetical protein
MVLGGRYLVTGHVLTSADQDMVLDGRDQVLNRDVSILVASSAHATQVAASARELATGERQGSIQVLDLGLSEGRTYLIAGGGPAPDDLLDMTREQQVYVEPFQTDTLGSEIFGEARTYEPHVYEDDEEYYEDLDDSFSVESPERRRPRFLKGISERLSQRLGSHDAAQDAVTGGAAAGVAGGDGEYDDDRAAGGGDNSAQDPYRSAIRRTQQKPLPDTVSDDEWTGTQDEVTVDAERRRAATRSGVESDRSAEDRGTEDRGTEDRGTEDRDTTGGPSRPTGRNGRPARPASMPEDDPAAGADTGEVPRAGVVGGAAAGAAAGVTAATAAGAGQATASAGAGSTAGAEAAQGQGAEVSPQQPKVSIWSGDEENDQRQHQDRARENAAPAAGPATVGAAPVHGDPQQSFRDAGPADRRGRDDEHYDEFADDDEDYHDEDKPRGARWILGGILALVLILGAVFAFNLLGNNRDPQAGEDATTSPAPGSPAESQTAGSDLPQPVITGATRLVPDSPELSADTDSTLPNAVDGNPATAWQTFSFAQPVFGGYASAMALVIELEEPSAINQVDIAQNNGSGGSFSVLLNDAPELDGARQIAEGSFTGPQVSVPVSGENGAPAEAQYVIINFTELPQLSNASANLPYGLRIAEVQVQ